jgi:predicted RNase H-like nuclease
MVTSGWEFESSLGVMPTMKKIGVDGCKAGWLAAVKDSTGKARFEVYPTISELWKAYKDADCIAIDIPIGFRTCEDGIEERRCDKEARKVLGKPRGSSVFVVPCREAIYKDTFEKASLVNHRFTGRKISRQTWAIMPKMREVDSFLQDNAVAREVFKEIHPEVCFWGLAGKKPMKANKKEWVGTEERIGVLLPFLPEVKDLLLEGMTRFKGKVVADDILDALAALVTIDEEEGPLNTLPENPEIDSTGLPMSMAYRLP